MDYGHAETDRKLKKLEKALTAQYGVANKELTKKMREYFEKFEKQDAEKLKLLNANKITEKDYLQWRQNKMLTGERWREVRDTVAKDLTNVNQISASMIRNEMVDAYALNANYGMFEIEKGADVSLSFSLYSHDTVERMIKDKKFPVPHVDLPKDQRWNRQKINSVMLQGVLQGQSIPKIANGLQKVTDMNRTSAIRNARTYITGAENRGRMDSYNYAESLGIEMEKVWMATLDGRTRDSHRKLDGEAVKTNEEFSNGCMYPGDPDCPDDSEIYNCRCTMVAELSKYSSKDSYRPSDYLKRNGKDYEDWKYEKDKESVKRHNQLNKDVKYIQENKFPNKEQQALANRLVDEYRKESGFSNPEEYVKKYSGLSPEEYSEKKLASMPEKANKEIKDAYRKLIDTEKEATKVMKNMASENGFNLIGLDARLKEGDSFMRKIDTRVKMRGMTYAEASKTVEDGCRYTIVSGSNDLVKNYNSVVTELSKSGYTVSSIENNFTDPNLAMNNLAVYFKSPNESTVEVWFHTEQTYKMLGENHKYYEAIRIRGDWTDDGSKALDAVLYKGYYDNIEMPKNIWNIEATERWGK